MLYIRVKLTTKSLLGVVRIRTKLETLKNIMLTLKLFSTAKNLFLRNPEKNSNQPMQSSIKTKTEKS